MKKGTLILLFLLSVVGSAVGQSKQEQQEFVEAKQAFSSENFSVAETKFREVLSLGTYYKRTAAFYYGISLYKQNKIGQATAQLNQIKLQHPTWKNIDEVYFWLATINFENEAYLAGMNNISGIRDKKKAADYKRHFLAQIEDNGVIRSMTERFPNDQVIATEMANRLLKQAPGDRDQAFLDFLIADYDLDIADFGMDVPNQSPKKATYKIAVLLPFGYSSGAVRGSGSNTIMSVYSGIEMAAKRLNKEKKIVEFFCYDTKADSIELKRILASSEFKGMDLMIGPLFPHTYAVAKKYSYENQLNLINPLSANSELTRGNPYSLLVKPGIQTQARKMADYIEDKVETKNAAIFYGKATKDSVLASAYRNELLKRKFQIKLYEKISDFRDSQKIIDWLSLEQVDEEALKEMGVREEDLTEPELPKFFLDTMELGHALIAGNNNDEVIVANSITSLVRRGDQFPLFGDLTWLDFRSINYDQIESQNVLLLAPDFADRDKRSYQSFKSAYFKEHNAIPTSEATFSYDLMLWLGEMLQKHGVYFQSSLQGNAYYEGNNQEGFQFGKYTDNQVVPIVQMRGSKLEMVNRENN